MYFKNRMFIGVPTYIHQTSIAFRHNYLYTICDCLVALITCAVLPGYQHFFRVIYDGLLMALRGSDEIKLYVKAGVDGERMGACPFCQRVFMVLMVKSQTTDLRFKVMAVSTSRPPPELKMLGLNHLPAILHNDDGYDNVDDIINYIDEKFPCTNSLIYSDPAADIVTKDFFSRFCFYIKAVNEDPSKLNSSLENLNAFLEERFYNGQEKGSFISSDNVTEIQFLCKKTLTHIDCEVLPKLQHLRVAIKALKNIEIPTNFHGLWRYLHSAYTNHVFTKTCPCDQEIILHWHDRPETPKLTHKMHAAIAKESPKFSYDIPVHAFVATVTQE